jgi:hypothetical protein
MSSGPDRRAAPAIAPQAPGQNTRTAAAHGDGRGSPRSRRCPRPWSSRSPSQVAIDVHRLVRDLTGAIVKDEMVRHVYAFRDGLIGSMEIQRADEEAA